MNYGNWKKVSLFFCLLVPVLTACDEGNIVVHTHRDAIDIMKKHIIENDLEKLKSFGVDESIFDNLYLTTAGDQPCGKPEKYSTIWGVWPSSAPRELMLVKLHQFKKGDCEGCWDIVEVYADMWPDGEITNVAIRREPAWVNKYLSVRDKRPLGDPGATCGPTSQARQTEGMTP